MKKQSLKDLSIGQDKILNRNELRSIAGGTACMSDADCPVDVSCVNNECGGSESGSCTYDMDCPSGSGGGHLSCTSNIGLCLWVYNGTNHVGVNCDGYKYCCNTNCT